MTGKIRIIGGKWRGRKLTVPDRPGLRPTGDRARETLFNWLQPRIAGAACLDLFAGTGAIGLEAASRGARRVVMVEKDRELAGQLDQLAEQWPGGDVVEVVHADALRWLEYTGERFDLVFVDPPFTERWQAQILEQLVSRQRLTEKALVYLEQGIDDPLPGSAGLEITRNKELGQVRMLLLATSPV